MDSNSQPVAQPAESQRRRRGLFVALVALLILLIVALLGLIVGTLAPAYAPALRAGLQELQRNLAQLQNSVIPAWPPREQPTAVSACAEQAVLAYEGRASALDQKASQSTEAAYTAYTHLIQVGVPYCLVTLKGYHVKLFYARYMGKRALDAGNAAEARKYADEINKYMDLATQERNRLAAQNGWGAYK